MKKLAFAALYALCFTTLATGTTFAAEKQDTAAEKITTAVQKAPDAEKNIKNEEQKCKKKTPQEVREAVDKIEKERCQ